MSLLILDWINVIVQIILMSMFLISVLKIKFSIRTTTLIIALIQLAAYLIAHYFKNIVFIKTPIISIITTVGIFCVSADSRGIKILLSFVFFMLISSSEAVSVFLYGFLTNFDYSKIYELAVINILCATFFSLVFFGISMVFVVYWKKIKGVIRFKLIGLLIIFPLSQILLLLGTYSQYQDKIPDGILLYGTVCLIAAIAFDYLMYKTINQTLKYEVNEQEFEFAKLQRKLQFEYYQLATENAEAAISLKHEINNQLQAAYVMFNQSESNKSKSLELMKAIEDKVNILDKIVYCDNPIINTVLVIKTAEAKSFSIETDIQIESIENIVIADIDLCSIFSNLYDNAIDSCKKYNGTSKKIIIKASERSGYLVIKVSNSCSEKIKINKNGSIETSKDNKKWHGYGLKLIRSITQKYDGEINFSLKDEIFEVVVLLKFNLKIY